MLLVTMFTNVPAPFLTLGVGELGDSLLLSIMGHCFVGGETEAQRGWESELP